MHDRAQQWGELVRARRVALELRQDEVAALAGVAVRSVHAVEASKPTVRLDILAAIATALGMQMSLEVGGEAVTLRP